MGFVQEKGVKKEEPDEEQVKACEFFMSKFYIPSYSYAMQKKITIFDIKRQIESYYQVCKFFRVQLEFYDIEKISVAAIVKAFENLEYTHDRLEVFYRFIYTGPKVWNSVTGKHKMPVACNDWAEVFHAFQGDSE